jgi:uncharacterized repeat protein (TIGR01451 family)
MPVWLNSIHLVFEKLSSKREETLKSLVRPARLILAVLGGLALVGLCQFVIARAQTYAQTTAVFDSCRQDTVVVVGSDVGTETINSGVMSGDPSPSCDHADLGVRKTVSDGTPREGDTIVYTIVVTNDGPLDATSVQLTDELPTGVTYITHTVSQGTYTDSLWTVARLDNAAGATMTITAMVDSGTAGETIINTAYGLAADQPDRISDNNEASVGITPSSGLYRLFLPIIFESYLPIPFCDTYREDDFSDSTSGWIIGDYGEADYSYVPMSLPDEYNIYSKEYTNIRSVSPASFGPFSQYTVKVKARWANVPLGDEYGIVFGVRGKDGQRVIKATSLYRFIIDTENNRHFALRGFDVEVDPEDWYPIVDWTEKNEVINGDTDANTLEVRCYGSWVALIANGNVVWEGQVRDCSGEIGVTSYPDPKNINTNARFDNLEVCGQRERESKARNSRGTMILVPDDSEFFPRD